MPQNPDFDLRSFLPYLLNQAAEETSIGFSKIYKEHYSLLRTEWRVLFHLGRYGDMTASEIVTRARIHKTKISRAVAALESKRFLRRKETQSDRRRETLSLLPRGKAAYADLVQEAEAYNRQLSSHFTHCEWEILGKSLERLAKLPDLLHF